MRDDAPGSRALTRTRRWAFVVPVLVCSVDWRALAPEQVALSLSFFAGLAAGVAWQRLYRRDLVDRLFGLSVLAVVLMAVVMLPGWQADSGAWGDADWLGVLVGLILSEEWSRIRRS